MKLLCENHKNLVDTILPNFSTKECHSMHGLDEYSSNHLLFGCIMREFYNKKNITYPLLIHLLWEYGESLDFTKKIINKIYTYINLDRHLYKGDSLVNFTSDNILFIAGYYLQDKIKINRKALSQLFIADLLKAQLYTKLLTSE